jgi:hypothetical protein
MAPGLAVICITFAQQMCAKMMWFVRQATTIELSMVAAERLREFAWLQPEAWAGLPAAAPPKSWPQSGPAASLIIPHSSHPPNAQRLLPAQRCGTSPDAQPGLPHPWSAISCTARQLP